MVYRITIKETKKVEIDSEKESNSYKTETRKVFVQEVDELDLVSVIRAIGYSVRARVNK